MSNRIQESDRDRVITILTEQFAADVISTEEYEERVSLANQAENQEQLNNLVREFTRQTANEPAEYRRSGLPVDEPRHRIVSVLGSQKLKGSWLRGSSALFQAVLGTITCELTAAQIGSGLDIQIYSLFSEVKISIPHGVTVVSDIAPILSEVKKKSLDPDDLPGAPVVRISGAIFLSEVKVKVR